MTWLPLSFSGRAGSVALMPWATLRRVIAAFTLLAFAGGMSLQAMPPALAAGADAPMMSGCDHMATAPQDAGTSHSMPSKGMTPECIKQMGCLGTPSLPVRLGAGFAPVTYSRVIYWLPAADGTGRTIKPDLFPPIGL
jgi:hypothetical protein